MRSFRKLTKKQIDILYSLWGSFKNIGKVAKCMNRSRGCVEYWVKRK